MHVTLLPLVFFTLLSLSSSREVVSRVNHLSEGPTLLRNGNIVFSGVALNPNFVYPRSTGSLYVYNPRRGCTTVLLPLSGETFGTALDAQDRLLLFQGANLGMRSVSRIDQMDDPTIIVLASGFHQDGHFIQFNSPNDGLVDDFGHILFTDPRYIGSETLSDPIQRVFVINPESLQVSSLITNAVKPNGIALCGSSLYISKSNNYKYDLLSQVVVPPTQSAIYEYEYHQESATLGNSSTPIVRVQGKEGESFDGIHLSKTRNVLYVAVSTDIKGAIYEYNLDTWHLDHVYELEPFHLATNVIEVKERRETVLYVTGIDLISYQNGTPSGILVRIPI